LINSTYFMYSVNTFSALLPLILILLFHTQFNMSKELRRERHTVSLLTDHMVVSPKYRGKVLVGDVAMLAEAIIRKTCKELDIEVIDMAVNLWIMLNNISFCKFSALYYQFLDCNIAIKLYQLLLFFRRQSLICLYT